MEVRRCRKACRCSAACTTGRSTRAFSSRSCRRVWSARARALRPRRRRWSAREGRGARSSCSPSPTSRNRVCRYKNAHSSLIRDLFPIVPTKLRVVFLHLELPREDIVERIRSRGRAEEKEITAEYLARLEEAHGVLKATMTTPERLGCEGTVEAPVKHVVMRADRPASELADVVLDVLSKLDG